MSNAGNHDITRMPPPKTQKILSIPVSPEAADLWFWISAFVLIGGAAAVALGTFGTIGFQAIKERYADERLSINERETTQAKADLEKSKENIAALTVQAEQLRKDAAEAKARQADSELKLAELREKLGRPRQIDADVFVARLAGVTKLPVIVSSADGDPDSYWLAFGIANALRKAGWQVSTPSEMPKEAKLCSGKFGGITVLSKTMSDDEANQMRAPPAERSTPFLALADALWNAVGENSTNFATCPFLSDENVLHVVVWPKWVILPKENP
jgi:hypothetical protein